MDNKYDFAMVDLTYTGGGIYVAYGELTDGTHFIASDDMYDVRFLDADPSEKVQTEIYGWYVSDDVEWQEAHLIRDIDDETECLDFWEEMLTWVEENEPDGNYALYDVARDKEQIAELRTRKNWR